MNLLSEETLVHYGAPGMKKGVRHWQYPDGRFTPEGKERYFGKPKESNIYNVEDISKLNKNNSIESVLFNIFFNNINKKIDERRKNEIFDSKTGLYLKNKITSIEDDASKVNPYYSSRYIGFSMNCSFCSATYIERRAGYDVVANSNKYGLNTGNTKLFSESIFSKNNIKDSYYNPNYTDIKSYKDSMIKTEKILNKLKDGEASIISIYNAKTYSGGHYLNAEKRNGEILIIDPQINEVYSLNKFKKTYNEWPVAGITNIDYKNLNFSSINAVNNISHSNKIKEVSIMNILSEETLIHYGIPGMKHGVRRWQYEDGRFTPEGKERYFGSKFTDIEKIIEKGKSIVDLIFKSNKSINKRIEKSLNKEIQQLMINKDRYTPQEYNTILNNLVFQKNVYNNNLKEYKKPSWWSNFSSSFRQKTADMAAEKIGRGVIEFLLG